MLRSTSNGESQRGVAGNIYKGRVRKVLPGMQSAFVDIGLERDAFLYVSDVVDTIEEFERLESADSDDDAPDGDGAGSGNSNSKTNGGNAKPSGRVRATGQNSADQKIENLLKGGGRKCWCRW